MPAGPVEQRRRLEALRDRLTDAVAEAGARDLAPLASQLRAVLSDIASLPDVTEASDVDDLASKRARRRAAASAS
jgi:hypothetical protein